jgi:hypothetical protein
MAGLTSFAFALAPKFAIAVARVFFANARPESTSVRLTAPNSIVKRATLTDPFAPAPDSHGRQARNRSCCALLHDRLQLEPALYGCQPISYPINRTKSPIYAGKESDLTRDTPHPRFRSSVVAALETVAAMRLNEGRNGDAATSALAHELNNVDRTIAIVEAASMRIKANDYSAVETLFAGQALALDAMFDKYARETTLDDIRFALRSQAQCRATFRALMQMKHLRDEKFSRKRNEQSGESSV